MVVVSRGLEKCSRADLAAPSVPSSCSWSSSSSLPGPDDSSFLVALEADLALPVGEGTGGELFHESFVMTAQSLQHGYKRAERGAGDHVGRVLAGLQEHGHDDPRDLRAAVLVGPERAADVLDDLDLGARVSAKADGFDSRSPVMSTPSPRTRQLARKARWTRRPAASMPLANWRRTSRRSVTRWSPHSHADHTRSGVRGGLPPARRTPRRSGLRQLVRGGQVLVGGVVDVQLGSGLRQLVRELPRLPPPSGGTS